MKDECEKCHKILEDAGIKNDRKYDKQYKRWALHNHPDKFKSDEQKQKQNEIFQKVIHCKDAFYSKNPEERKCDRSKYEKNFKPSQPFQPSQPSQPSQRYTKTDYPQSVATSLYTKRMAKRMAERMAERMSAHKEQRENRYSAEMSDLTSKRYQKEEKRRKQNNDLMTSLLVLIKHEEEKQKQNNDLIIHILNSLQKEEKQKKEIEALSLFLVKVYLDKQTTNVLETLENSFKNLQLESDHKSLSPLENFVGVPIRKPVLNLWDRTKTAKTAELLSEEY